MNTGFANDAKNETRIKGEWAYNVFVHTRSTEEFIIAQNCNADGLLQKHFDKKLKYTKQID